VSAQPGITTRHCFSAGAHYDPANTAFGSLLALDEHVVAPGAGFAKHAHRGVDVVSWVLAGTLRHEDSTGGAELVRPGTVLHQSAGSGIEHVERNASGTEPLQFLQLVLLGDVAVPRCQIGVAPLAVAGGRVDVLRPAAPIQLAATEYLHLFVARGTVVLAEQALEPGDSARLRDAVVIVEGAGEILVWRSGDPQPDLGGINRMPPGWGRDGE
jgi:redox-sensitive bicupin YhaK (pirin superfamily)